MTGTFNRAKNYKVDHTRFGGLIYLSDFKTDCIKNNIKGSPIAKRITKDIEFDNKCRDSIMFRKSNT